MKEILVQKLIMDDVLYDNTTSDYIVINCIYQHKRNTSYQKKNSQFPRNIISRKAEVNV